MGIDSMIPYFNDQEDDVLGAAADAVRDPTIQVSIIDSPPVRQNLERRNPEEDGMEVLRLSAPDGAHLVEFQLEHRHGEALSKIL